ncbi:ADP-forming succinate--CoA ligase subunit beta [Candidatus Spongiihabitans sp.]|uniref:ADP-forming succinate--CoA ligase subunit beta n=1 Tax=Candidatus Spongiihabitans sp. TaxID=3101308 RepID=UPI003C7DAF76
MNLYEYQGKRLLAGYGIAIPKGEIAITPEQAGEVGNRLGGEQWMVKAQIRSGGRGEGRIEGNQLTSGVHKADSITSIRRFTNDMLGNKLITRQTGTEGASVDRVYIEQALVSGKELSMAMLVDAKVKKVVLLYSDKGGTNIESVAARHPDSIHTLEIDWPQGAPPPQLESMVKNLDLEAALAEKAKQVVNNMYKLFIERDASLVEINPLVVVGDDLVALDAKIAMDENAMFRQQDNQYLEQDNYRLDGRLQASRDGFNYFKLDGNIGCLAVGAGLSMATIDAIKYLGGEPANFLDLPPDSKVSRSRSAIELVLSSDRINSVLINVFGGGIMRCDTIADAILLVNQSSPITVPLIVRLAGTNAALAIRRLRESMPNIILARNMAEAAEQAVALANPIKSDRSEMAGQSPWKSRFKRFVGDRAMKNKKPEHKK